MQRGQPIKCCDPRQRQSPHPAPHCALGVHATSVHQSCSCHCFSPAARATRYSQPPCRAHSDRIIVHAHEKQRAVRASGCSSGSRAAPTAARQRNLGSAHSGRPIGSCVPSGWQRRVDRSIQDGDDTAASLCRRRCGFCAPRVFASPALARLLHHAAAGPLLARRRGLRATRTVAAVSASLSAAAIGATTDGWATAPSHGQGSG